MAFLKAMQNKAYNCSNKEALSKCVPLIKSANEILSAITEKQEGLSLTQEDKFRYIFPANKV